MDLDEFLRRGSCALPRGRPEEEAEGPDVLEGAGVAPWGLEEKGLRSLAPPLEPYRDQGGLPVCASSAIAAAMEMLREDVPRLSEAFNYRTTAGPKAPHAPLLEVEDCLRSAADRGLCKGASYPLAHAVSKDEPPSSVVAEAERWRLAPKGGGYRFVVSPQIPKALDDGYPIVLAFALTDGYEGVQGPDHAHGPATKRTGGGHAVLIFSSQGDRLRVLDSYAPKRTDGGTWWLPRSLFEQPAFRHEAWAIRKLR